MIREFVVEPAETAAKLRATIKSFEESAAAAVPTGRDNRISAKAEISALQTEVDEHRKTIQALRTEVAGNNERLTRQAQHFRDEMRRLSSGARTADEREAPSTQPRRSLADRIAQPRIPASAGSAQAQDGASEPVVIPAAAAAPAPVANEVRQNGFLRALNGGGAEAATTSSLESKVRADKTAAPAADGATAPAASEPPRRPRLLERISSIEKS